MRLAKSFAVIAFFLSLMGPIARGDDWAAPRDGVFTEDQLKRYMEAAKDWNDINAKIIKQVTDAQTTAGKIDAVKDIDQKHDQCLAQHHFSKEEFDWMSSKVSAAWAVAQYADEIVKKSNEQFAAQSKETDDHIAEAQKRSDAYQAASKAGTRVMTDDDRDAAIKSSKSDPDNIKDEIKQHADDAVAAEKEAKEHDADAATADDLGKNPPADVTGDDRASYIDGKKTEAQNARDAAKDARSREDDDNKAKADAQARYDAAVTRAAHPEVPLTDDDKASVKTDNDNGLASATSDLSNYKQQKTQLAAAEAETTKSVAQMYQEVPEKNVELMKKNSNEYRDIYQKILTMGATTQR